MFKRLSRRSTLAVSAAIGLALLLAACGSDNSSDSAGDVGGWRQSFRVTDHQRLNKRVLRRNATGRQSEGS